MSETPAIMKAWIFMRLGKEGSDWGSNMAFGWRSTELWDALSARLSIADTSLIFETKISRLVFPFS
ncbi:hypothetical protein [Mesorhizobium shangrilense]|uniref:Uncharacterized protein n=1 Tax=Mesorhizobium shangrilense TaxID=460060 RepID=A0ABV2DGW4_9HYPH